MPRRRRIIYAQYTNPPAYPPLEHSSGILADAGWEVSFLGVTGEGDSNRLELLPHPRVGVSLMPLPPPGWKQKMYFAGFTFWVAGQAAIRRPAALYCSEFWTCPAGLAASWLGVPVLYHEHDPPGEPEGGFRRLLHSCRALLAKRALACILPNELRRQDFVKALAPRASFTVFNCPRRLTSMVPSPRRDGPFAIWYHGSIVPSQLPLSVIDALHASRRDVVLRFAGYEPIGHKGYASELVARAQMLGVSDRIRYLGVLPSRVDLFRAASDSDLGLALFAKPFRAPMVGASNKPWEYLACGLPILASDDDEWRAFVEGAEVGAVCDPTSPEDIARRIDEFASRDDRGREMGERGQRRIAEQDWNYESQFAPVATLLERLAPFR